MDKKFQKIMFLLGVGILLLTGCGRQEKENLTDAGVVIGTDNEADSDVAEEVKKEETDSEEEKGEAVNPGKSNNEERTDTGGSGEKGRTEQQTAEPDRQNENSGQTQRTETAKNETEAQGTSGQNGTEESTSEPEQTSEAVPVSYSPQRVVELAVEKTKAQGKIYIPDDLNQMLAAGEISQEDFNASYPTDGAGYLEYYVAADMNEARDVSGTVQFSSEADIAANIAGMYASLPQQYFYIEYHGTVTYGGKECYVFYCYRA